MNITEIIAQLEKVETWSSAALIVAACIVIGYVLKFIKAFPNNYIPLTVIFLGSVLMLLMAPAMPKDQIAVGYYTRQSCIGLVFGLAAWLLHNVVLSRVEDYLGSKFPAVGNLLNNASTQTKDEGKV